MGSFVAGAVWILEGVTQVLVLLNIEQTHETVKCPYPGMMC